MQYGDATINPSTEILIAENIKVLREAQKMLERMDDRTYTKVDGLMVASPYCIRPPIGTVRRAVTSLVSIPNSTRLATARGSVPEKSL